MQRYTSQLVLIEILDASEFLAEITKISIKARSKD